MTERANEPAYPAISSKRDAYAGQAVALVTSTGGLTIREHFAGLAMQGILANPYYAQQANGPDCDGNLMKAAMYHADALIAALGEKK